MEEQLERRRIFITKGENKNLRVIKMLVVMTLFTMLLFVLLTPGVVLRIPKNGKLVHQAIVHGLVFAVVYHFTHKVVWAYFYR